MVTLKELEDQLYECEKIVTRLKAEISHYEDMTHPELNKVYCALKKIYLGDEAE